MAESCETNPPSQAGPSDGNCVDSRADSGADSRASRDHSWTLGVDICETEGRMTGVGRYTMNLLEEWLDPATEVCAPDLVLFARDAKQVPASLRDQAEVVSSRVGGRSQLGVVRWQQLHLPRLLHKRPVDLLFGPAYAIPILSRTPAVVALHDLSFERDPSAFSRKEAFRRQRIARASARRARGIVTISNFSKKEIEHLYRVPAGKVRMVYPSCDQAVFKPADGDLATRPAGLDKPFLLAVGTLLERRNIAQLIAAFARLDSSFEAHQLVIVGSNQTRRPRIDFDAIAEREGVADRVVFEPHVEERRLVQLYRSTELLVSLSSYEGFGLPVLEAVCCGAPALLVSTEVHRELWSGTLLMVDSTEATEVAEAIQQAAGRPPSRQAVQAARERFNHADGAAKVLRFLSETARS